MPDSPDISADLSSEHASDHRCGRVALIGRPNAGKSTLLNQILGQKLSIVSARPQTTRNRVVGIHTEPGLQAIIVDTPGIHLARSRLNQAMVQAALDALQEVDLVCWVIDLDPCVEAAKTRRPVLSRAEHEIARSIAQAGKVPLVLALNKADCVPKPWILPVMEALHGLAPDAALVPISALKGEGVPELVAQWRAMLPIAPPLFPEDQVATVTERFLCAELIREKIFHLVGQEIPYSTAVEIELFDEQQRESERPRVHIMARILVERDSQKAILIGKGGSMLKQIGTLARKEIAAMLGASVFLELHVVVQPHWRESARDLRDLGYE